MFEEEIIPHKVHKKTSVSRNIYPDISKDIGIITPRSTDETNEGEHHFHMNTSTELPVNVSSSNENMKDAGDLEIEEIVKRRSGEEEEEEEEEEFEEISPSQPMPPFSHSIHPAVSKHTNIKETNVSKVSRLGHLQPSPEPAVLNIDTKKKSKKKQIRNVIKI